VTYLDHDHRERENIRFFATFPLFGQDLWRSPPRGMSLILCGTLLGTCVFSDRGEAKIRDACVTTVVHEDIRLAECQRDGKPRFRTISYSFEVPVNHIAGVEVAEALSDVR